ncbi:MAG TPA: hypothetical protein VE981_04360 [Planctomycetota bacterium]|nr:hypothetical protein [Planctomycetota bacterium]
MKLSEISAEDVLAGKLWIIEPGQDGNADPGLKEAVGFAGEDIGLISAVVRIADGSEHLGLVVKSFPQGGDDVDIYMKTNFGWLNIHANGFMRALGKYSHEIFPFDYFLSSPWKGGKQPEPDRASSHSKIFKDTAVRLKSKTGAAKKK